jgi:hypothetical protein
MLIWQAWGAKVDSGRFKARQGSRITENWANMEIMVHLLAPEKEIDETQLEGICPAD